VPAVERFMAKNGIPFEAMVPSEAVKKPMLAGSSAAAQ
jgi:hypothetical protein